MQCHNDDHAISILRHFGWNQAKIEEAWFDNMDELELKIGIKYNTELVKKYKDINASLKENNDNTCAIMYMEFDEDDEEFKAE